MTSANIWLWHFVYKKWMTCLQKQQTSSICQSREQRGRNPPLLPYDYKGQKYPMTSRVKTVVLNLDNCAHELALFKSKVLFFTFLYHWKQPLRFFCFIRNFNSDDAEASKFLTYFGNNAKVLSAKNKNIWKTLKSSEYEFNMFSLVNVKVNFNFGIHQTKCLVLILVNMFHVTCLLPAEKNTDVRVYLQHASWFTTHQH